MEIFNLIISKVCLLMNDISNISMFSQELMMKLLTIHNKIGIKLLKIYKKRST